MARRYEGIIESDLIRAVSPTCFTCKHLNTEGYRECTAFPDGIPMVIWQGENRHRLPYPGDHGIQYEKMDFSTTAKD